MIAISKPIHELESLLIVKQQNHKLLQKRIGKMVSCISVGPLRDQAELLQQEIDHLQSQITNQKKAL